MCPVWFVNSHFTRDLLKSLSFHFLPIASHNSCFIYHYTFLRPRSQKVSRPHAYALGTPLPLSLVSYTIHTPKPLLYVTPHALLPSLLAAASSYATFVALVGTEPVVPLLDQESSSLLAVQAVDLLGALLLGIGAGLGGRGFAWLVRRAKGLGKELPVLRRLLIGGVTMAALAVVSHEAFGT